MPLTVHEHGSRIPIKNIEHGIARPSPGARTRQEEERQTFTISAYGVSHSRENRSLQAG